MGFEGAGQKPGIEIWRIEKMEAVLQEELTATASAGGLCKIFSGDSYLFLHTVQPRGSSKFEFDLFFWLGNETSQDEKGAAAYKTVELDDFLGGDPVQHRETQGHETSAFMSLFKGGLEYNEGGIESGFKKVDRDAFDTRLLHLKGKRHITVTQVDTSGASLNSGDVFILDKGMKIWQWNGSGANRMEKAKALDVTVQIKDNERGGKAAVIVLDEGEDDDAEFWETLGGKPDAIAAATDDDDSASASAIKLFRLSDASGELETTEVETRPLKQADLDPDDVFILDLGRELFVWVGAGATKEEKNGGMTTAAAFLAKFDKPDWTPITRVVEGSETVMFKSNFAWPPKQMAVMDFNKPMGGGNVAKTGPQASTDDIAASIAAIKQAEDDPTEYGTPVKTEVWRIENFDKVAVPEDQYGLFFGGDSYIVLYTYEESGREEYIIYFWQGRSSSTDEVGSSALLAKDLDDSMGGRPVQVRVVQDKEPAHFYRLFHGRMVVRDGDQEDGGGPLPHLFHVKGSNDSNTRAAQADLAASSLNSGDCFLLVTDAGATVWKGQFASDDEVAVAQACAERLADGKSVQNVTEGDEPDDFWEALGGKGEYPTFDAPDAVADPRLFEVSNATGTVKAEEIFNFSQDDLEQDNAFIVDCGNTVYVWIGSEANAAEKKMAPQIARDYIKAKSAVQGGAGDTSVVIVPAGSEPPMFRTAFMGWDAEAAKVFVDPYEARMAALRAERGEDADEEEPTAGAVVEKEVVSAEPGADGFFSMEQLKAGVEWPAGVDGAKREQYLSDADFESVFGMDKAAFGELKGWKSSELKKKHGLW